MVVSVDDDVRGVDGHALGTVGGDGVAEVDVLGDVGGREHDRCAELGALSSYDEGAVGAYVR